MKTREEVLKHLFENGYSEDGICRILGFMVARELKTLDERVTYKKGDRSFEDFYKWYYDCDVPTNNNDGEEVELEEDECYCPDCVRTTLIEDVCEMLLEEIKFGSEDGFVRRVTQLDFLLNLRGVEEEDED